MIIYFKCFMKSEVKFVHYFLVALKISNNLIGAVPELSIFSFGIWPK